MIFINRG
jgi:hypothetical protein